MKVSKFEKMGELGVINDNLKLQWTLFLDRDGVINEKIEKDYVKNWEEFTFIKGSIEAIAILASIFFRIVIVTNQRGVGKGLMKLESLHRIHEKMMGSIRDSKGDIHGVYYCTDIEENSFRRKPNIGMAMDVKRDFSEVCFQKSIMVGDSQSDIIFGEKLGMKTVFIGDPVRVDDFINRPNLCFDSLIKFTDHLLNKDVKSFFSIES